MFSCFSVFSFVFYHLVMVFYFSDVFSFVSSCDRGRELEVSGGVWLHGGSQSHRSRGFTFGGGRQFKRLGGNIHGRREQSEQSEGLIGLKCHRGRQFEGSEGLRPDRCCQSEGSTGLKCGRGRQFEDPDDFWSGSPGRKGGLQARFPEVHWKKI